MRRPRSRSNLSRPSAPVVQPYQAVIARPVRTANCSFSFATLMTISLSEKFRYIPTTVQGEPIHTKFVLAGILAAPISFPMCAAIRSVVVRYTRSCNQSLARARGIVRSWRPVVPVRPTRLERVPVRCRPGARWPRARGVVQG
jgi:hypothetical protein